MTKILSSKEFEDSHRSKLAIQKSIALDSLLEGKDSSFFAHDVKVAIACPDDKNIIVTITPSLPGH